MRPTITRESLLAASTQWKPIPGWPAYQVSNVGLVKRADGRILKPLYGTGYLVVRLCSKGKRQAWPAHRLIYELFIGPIPPGLHINHIDGVKTNNAFSNLEAITPAENTRHASRMGLLATGDRNGVRTHPERMARGERAGSSKLTAEKVREIRKRRAAGESYSKIARDYGVHLSAIHLITSRKSWAHVE